MRWDTRGRPDLGSSGKTSGFSVKTPRSTRSPPVIYLSQLVFIKFLDIAPFRYSGRPVISSTPWMCHCRCFSRTSTRMYVNHMVNLWNGTSSSPSILVSDTLREGQGQTSPREMAPRARHDGQIELSPSIRACHRAARGTTLVVPSS